MQVIVAFILEAFVFRIQYRMVMNGQDMDGAFWWNFWMNGWNVFTTCWSKWLN